LGLFFDETVDLGVNWTCNYLSGHPIFRFDIGTCCSWFMDSCASP
jgi:hypothetical protein